MGMKHAPNLMIVDTVLIQTIAKILCNSSKLSILQYIIGAKVASAGAILGNVNISQSYLSKCLKSMTASGILIKQKIFSSTIYKINYKTCNQFIEQLGVIGIFYSEIKK
jgi:predicted transcriptional regulator